MENEQHPNSETRSTELGKVEIAPEVLQIIGGLAALQVNGVAGTSGGVVSDITQFLGRKNPRQGIKVELEDEVRITVSIIVSYGYNIPDVGRKVQEQVKHAVESMTGLQVSRVTVRVVEVRFGEEDAAADNQETSQRMK